MNINKRYYIFIYPEVKLNFLDKYPENLMGGFLDIWALGGVDFWIYGGVDFWILEKLSTSFVLDFKGNFAKKFCP